MATFSTMSDLLEAPRSTLTTLTITALPLIAVAYFLLPMLRSKDQQRLIDLTLPMWMFLEAAFGSDVLLTTGRMTWLSNFLEKRNLFGLTSRHKVVRDPALAAALLRQPTHTLENKRAITNSLWGALGVPTTLVPKMHDIWHSIHSVIMRNMLTDKYLKEYTAIAAAKVQRLAPRLISIGEGSTTERWQERAEISSESGTGSFIAQLNPLIRDFVGVVSMSLIMGDDFLDSYPTGLADFNDFDAAFAPLTIGVPKWLPVDLFRQANGGRDRFAKAVGAALARHDAVVDGHADSTLEARMADVSPLLKERASIQRDSGMTVKERGQLEVGLVWGATANTTALAFWMITYIITTPGLADVLRTETAEAIKVTEAGPDSGSSSPNARQVTKLDTHALVNDCPRLKSCLFETLRIANLIMSIRNVVRPFTVKDPSSGKPLHFEAGSVLTFPHNIIANNPALFPEPDAFKPERFLKEAPPPPPPSEASGNANGGATATATATAAATEGEATGSTEPQRLVASPGLLKPWGQGHHMCPGRVFAEREVLACVMTLLHLWDFEALDPVPPHAPGGGVVSAGAPMRVAIKPRKL